MFVSWSGDDDTAESAGLLAVFGHGIRSDAREIGERSGSIDDQDCNAHNDRIAVNHSQIMAALTIRNVDDAIKTALRVRAARHGVSMEEEARRILRDALSRAGESVPMGQRLSRRFRDAASAEFTLPERSPPRSPPDWD